MEKCVIQSFTNRQFDYSSNDFKAGYNYFNKASTRQFPSLFYYNDTMLLIPVFDPTRSLEPNNNLVYPITWLAHSCKSQPSSCHVHWLYHSLLLLLHCRLAGCSTCRKLSKFHTGWRYHILKGQKVSCLMVGKSGLDFIECQWTKCIVFLYAKKLYVRKWSQNILTA